VSLITRKAAFSRLDARDTTQALTIYCWLSTSAPTARPSYVMPGGGKKGNLQPTL